MKNFIQLILASCVILLNGCGSNTSNHAEDLCNCMQEVGLDESVTTRDLSDRQFQRDISNKAERILPKCLANVLRSIDEDLADLNKEGKNQYMKALMKDIIDTECSDLILDKVPFDLLNVAIDEIEEKAERRREMREYLEGEIEALDESDLEESLGRDVAPPPPGPAESFNEMNFESTDMGTTEYLQFKLQNGQRKWTYSSDKNPKTVNLGVKNKNGSETIYFLSDPSTLYQIDYITCGFILKNLKTKKTQSYRRTYPRCWD